MGQCANYAITEVTGDVWLLRRNMAREIFTIPELPGQQAHGLLLSLRREGRRATLVQHAAEIGAQ